MGKMIFIAASFFSSTVVKFLYWANNWVTINFVDVWHFQFSILLFLFLFLGTYSCDTKTGEKPDFVARKQQWRRPACASPHSDQRLCDSLYAKFQYPS